MAAIKCSSRTVCCTPGDGDEALANFSMSSPDPNRFLSGVVHTFQPPLGYNWGALACGGWIWSTVSSEDAFMQALAAQQQCVITPPEPNPNPNPNPNPPGGGGPGGNPGWTNPDGTPVELFPNQAQTCNGECADGTPYSYTLPAGSIYALSTAQANYKANGFACQLAAANALCLNSISPLDAGCPGEEYDLQLQATGNAFPYVWTIEGGTLAPGLSMSSSGRITGTIDASALGDYTATIRVTDANNVSQQKNFVIGVCGAVESSTLAAYEIGSAYSAFITGVNTTGCGTGAQTFTLMGTLVPGLTLDISTGEISGTPTVAASGDYNFSVQVSTALSACTKEFTIPESAVSEFPLRVYNNSPDPQEIFAYANVGSYDVYTLLNAGIFWIMFPGEAVPYVVDVGLQLVWAGGDTGLIRASADAMFTDDLGTIINTSPLNLGISGLVITPAGLKVGIESGATVSPGPWLMTVTVTVV